MYARVINLRSYRFRDGDRDALGMDESREREKGGDPFARGVRVTIMARSRAIIYRSLRSPRCRRNVHEGGKDNIEREKRGCKRPCVEGIGGGRVKGER